MTMGMTLRVASPAKVNLGLEILGRRDDGYHEITSVLAMVDLCDELTFTLTEGSRSHIAGMPDVPDESNLILKAIHAFNGATERDSAWLVTVTKRIPAPSGLGGASSNAASTLLALNHAAGLPLDTQALHELASSLGSDVPFFLEGPAALVSGTGTRLTPLPAPQGWVAIIAPRTALEAKTATLYGMLDDRDFSDGSAVEGVVAALEHGTLPAPGELANAFSRPLEMLLPGVAGLRSAMKNAGIDQPALSGAGPAHFAIFPDQETANEIKARLMPILEMDADLFVAPFRLKRILVSAT